MPKYKEEETLKETYTDEELEQLLKRPADTCRFSVYRTWVIINFLLNAGCRAATVRNIMVSDVDLLQQQVFFRHTKNRKVQVIPLCSQMTKILREYMSIRGGEDDSYLFCDEFGEQLTENALRLAVARYNKSRGVTKTSIHLFRHTFARKYLIDCGGDAFTLQKLMGHSTLKMTKHYCAIFDADIAKNYDNFSPLAQIKQHGERVRLKR
jgi:integrase/recombinase XerD